MPILELRGCTPEPLGNYLKGLGVFRLIAEQADPRSLQSFAHESQNQETHTDGTGP